MEEQVTQPIYNIVGEKVALGPMSRDYLPTYRRWINDYSTLRTLAFTPVAVTAEYEDGWYDRASRNGPDSVFFTIFEKATGRLIGNSDCRIDERHRSAGFGILIGEPDARGRGYGTEAMRLLLDYAFTARGMHSAHLSVYAFNHAARRCYEKAGFKECGRRRQCHQVAGVMHDEITMDCLASEFESPVLERVFAAEAVVSGG